MGLISREEAVRQAQLMFGTVDHDWGRAQRERASKSKNARDAANASAAVEKMSRGSRERIEQLERVKAWAEYHGGRALMFHDLAARACEQRDTALALVAELETGGKTV